jgi:hypothetical protein
MTADAACVYVHLFELLDYYIIKTNEANTTTQQPFPDTTAPF